MMERRALLGGLLAAAGLAACGATEPAWEVRFRLKVNALSGGEPRQGVGVFRARYTRYPEGTLNRPSEFRTELWGEAVPVELGGMGHMFAILGSINGIVGPSFDPGREYSLTQLLPAAQRTPDDILSGQAFEALREMPGEMFLPRTLWPIFIRFPDPSQQASARLVIPADQNYRLSNNTPREGESAIDLRIASVAVEITEDAPASSVEQLLPWVSDLPGAHEGRYTGGGPQRPLSERLRYRHFKMEGYAR
jgi:hypothetical protein